MILLIVLYGGKMRHLTQMAENDGLRKKIAQESILN